MIENALQATDFHQTRAAERLGVNEQVLRYKLNKHGIGS
jgi:DNA-binding protein Fis